MQKKKRQLATALTIAFAFAVTPAAAAADDDPNQQQQQREQIQNNAGLQTQDGAQEHDRDRTRDQLRNKIDEASGLTESQRQQMRANLDACLDNGMTADAAAAMFPDGSGRKQLSADAMLRLQQRVVNAARDGVNVDPILAKIQEGRTKGAPEPALEAACERMENHARTASRVMEQLPQSRSATDPDPKQHKRMQGEVAQHMWRGMNEEGYDQLQEHARKRLQSGECSAEDVVAAGEVAVRFLEAGVNRGRAVEFAGAALENGYRQQEMRQIQLMLVARHQRGESMDDFIGGMEHCVGAGMGPGEMHSYMIRHGWMGPGDMYGPGGNQPAQPKGHGTGGNDDGKGKHKGGGVR